MDINVLLPVDCRDSSSSRKVPHGLKPFGMTWDMGSVKFGSTVRHCEEGLAMMEEPPQAIIYLVKVG